MRTVILQRLTFFLATGPFVWAADTKPAPLRPETKRVRWATGKADARHTYHVARMRDRLVIDADWNKPAWKDIAPLVPQYYMGDEPTHQPRAEAKVAYDKENLYVIWRVHDRYVKAVADHHQGRVWLDSCVEFFFTPEENVQDLGYFNLETNCIGKMLFAAHPPGRKEIRLPPKDLAQVEIASSLKGPIDPEISKPTVWTLEYRLPLSVLADYARVRRPGPGVTWRANFYKCGDETSHPHWLTWAPVANDEPKFHLPKYFGKLVFD